MAERAGVPLEGDENLRADDGIDPESLMSNQGDLNLIVNFLHHTKTMTKDLGLMEENNGEMQKLSKKLLAGSVSDRDEKKI